MNYPSIHELDKLSQRLTHLLGYVPKDTEVSDFDLLQRYQRIRQLHATQS